MNLQKIKHQILTLIKSQTNIINSTQTFRQYIATSQRRGVNNEETVVQPFTISCLKILNYLNQHNLTIEEIQRGNKPDFHSDKFIVECKSSRYKNFSEKYGREETPEEQLKRYLETPEFFREYGILFSLEKLFVYKLVDGELKLVENLSFSILEFFEGKSTNIDNFITEFYVRPITIEEKIRIIAETQREDLIPIQPKIFNKILKSLIKEISIELNSKFVELDETDDDTKLIRDKVCQIKKQMDLKTTSEAEIEYLLQTSYIILARILLTKCWEDLDIIEPPLTYNGGFKKYLEEYHEKVEDVYKRALNKSQEIYFLFNPNNPYLLISLSEKLIVDILFQICKYDFNTLSYDVLGYIYEDYLDLENRKKFGQYYTPPYVVNLILDRVGYKPSTNKLLDNSVLDPASGSGTFLLNAVNRVLQSRKDGRDHSIEYKNIIENEIFGSELMLFPYLISEINILIQISQVLHDIILKGKKLNVLHVFPNNSFNLINKTIITRIMDIPEDNVKGDTIMDSAIINRKENKLRTLQQKVDFDYVVGNPPYVANDTNPDLFREMRELFTFCNQTYHNKMDLLYWFVILGILKLKPGGKLCYITTRYWLAKGEKTGVETFKKYILEYCYLREVVDLRNLNVFVSATGQENIIFILERKNDRVGDTPIKIFRINSRPIDRNCKLKDCIFEKGYCANDQEYLECLCSRESEWDDLLETEGSSLSNYISAYHSAKMSSELEYNRSWGIFYSGEGIIREILDAINSSCSRDIEKVDIAGNTYVDRNVVKYIKDFYVIRVGVLTTKDEVFILTPDILKIEGKRYILKIESTINLKRSEKQNLIELYDGEIDEEGYVSLVLSDIEKQRLMDLYKTPSVYQHGLDITKDVGKLIFFDDEREYNNCPVLIHYLEQFKTEIEDKLRGYNELNPARPRKWITVRRSGSINLPNREKRNLYDYYRERPKIFYNYRVGNNNIFGFTNDHMVAATDMYFFHKYGEKINTYYILAYLNSKIMTYFFKERPIELQRQKSNVENDIPIFLPRNEREEIVQKLIIKLERALTKKLQKLEKIFRLNGYHFDLNNFEEDSIIIDLQKILKDVKMPTIEDLSRVIKGELEIYVSDRKAFPILIINPYKIEKIGQLSEKVLGTDVFFEYKSLKIVVNERFYKKVKMAVESYFSFADSGKFSELSVIKIPSSKAMEIINIKKQNLNHKLAQLTSDDKIMIETVIDDILSTKKVHSIEKINSISKILYFIDCAFIKMMTPKYKDDILTY